MKFRNSARSTTDFEEDVSAMTFEDLTKHRNMRYFSDSARTMVDLISMQDHITPVGSFQYRAMSYPCDIDMCEEVHFADCAREDAARRVAESFANIARRISLEPKIYLSDFKIGYDERLRGGVELGKSIDSFDDERVKKEILALRAHRLISERKQDTLLALVDGVVGARSNDDANAYFVALREAHRQLFTLRWRLGELLIGRKRLADGTELPLWRAVANSSSIMKIDTWAEVVDDLGQRKFVDLTNFFVLSYGRSEGKEEGSLTQPSSISYREAVTKDISTFSSEGTRNSMKLARRLWVRAVEDEDVAQLRRLYPLFQSPIAALAQVSAEAEVIRTMASKLGRRQGMILPVLDRLVAQAMGFNKRIKAKVGWGSGSGGASGGIDALYGIRDRAAGSGAEGERGLRDEGSDDDVVSHTIQELRDSVDSILNPMYYEAKFQLADEGLHGGYVKETFVARLGRLQMQLDRAVEEYTRRYLDEKGVVVVQVGGGGDDEREKARAADR
eukprot:g1349.t1